MVRVAEDGSLGCGHRCAASMRDMPKRWLTILVILAMLAVAGCAVREINNPFVGPNSLQPLP